MRRGRVPILLIALLCLLPGACASRTGTRSDEALGPNPGTAIALSVLSDAVYLIDPVTGRRAEVAAGLLDFQSGYATWAPSHYLLAYANDAIYVMDFVRNQQLEIARGQNLSMPSWSPQGDQLVYGDGVSMWRTTLGSSSPGRLRIPATLAPLDMDWGANGLVAFEGLARDCSRSQRCPSTDRSEIWVLDPDKSTLGQITRVGHAESPKWSPDGSRILFIRRVNSTAASRELWVVNADGSGAHRLLSETNVVAADWSPDGSRIAVVRAGTPRSTLQLWIADLDGSHSRAVGPALSGTEATLDW
jgi:Tol biopolymer transport system component